MSYKAVKFIDDQTAFGSEGCTDYFARFFLRVNKAFKVSFDNPEETFSS